MRGSRPNLGLGELLFALVLPLAPATHAQQPSSADVSSRESAQASVIQEDPNISTAGSEESAGTGTSEAELFNTLPDFDIEFQGVGVLEEVTVIATPSLLPKTPGVPFNRRQLSANVQIKTAEDIRESGAINATDFLNTQFQSVTVNDTSGNPFRQDVNFRGFSASPLIATPQGVSVYLDGVRINESFGDIVNWDLLPLVAIDSVSIIPGSNPMFGRNTIAGALTMGTKSGFSAPGFDVTMLYGSWERFQTQVSAGASNDNFAALIAFNNVSEDGWRKNSPSDVTQFFGRGDFTSEYLDLTVTALKADTKLFGNGTVPSIDYAEDRTQVFTSPDITNNSLTQFTLRGTVYPTVETAISATGYRRKVEQSTQSGDFWDDFEELDFGRQDTGCTAFSENGNPVVVNGFFDGVVGPGTAGCYPNGLFNIGGFDQNGSGFSVQFTYANDWTELVIGANRDKGSVEFSQSQLLGYIDEERAVQLDPDRVVQKDQFGAILGFNDVAGCVASGFFDAEFCEQNYADLTIGSRLLPTDTSVLRNFLKGETEDLAFYFFNALRVSEAFTLSFGVRHNRSKVKNFLASDTPTALWEFTREEFENAKLECKTSPTDRENRLICTEEEIVFDSWNPAFGATFEIDADHSVHFNRSYGTRTPSAVELACARPENEDGYIVGCTIPTNLTNDPPLEQVRSKSIEFGLRKYIGEEIELSITAYQTKLENDILFLSLGRGGRGVFENFGETRRRGLEIGASDSYGRLRWFVNYNYLKATFESDATAVNSSNSSSAGGFGVIPEYNIKPGDTIPGLPSNSLRMGLSFDVTPKFTASALVIAQGSIFAQGNENNEHVAGGTDSFGDGRADPNDPCFPYVTDANGECFTAGRPYVGGGKVDGFWTLNLDFTYRPTDSVTIALNVDNVLNREFETVGNLGLSPFQRDSVNAPNAAVDAAGFNFNSANWKHDLFLGPGAPRAAWMSVNWRFSDL